nr:MAG TPA: hypothetical protein [Caudoviricetes sp.]
MEEIIILVLLTMLLVNQAKNMDYLVLEQEDLPINR